MSLKSPDGACKTRRPLPSPDRAVGGLMREFLSRHLFSPLQGMRFSTWWSFLRQNRFAVDFRYWPRAAFQTGNSLNNSLIATWENARWSKKLETVQVQPPLFILGHYRSGTTHLHNLLSM